MERQDGTKTITVSFFFFTSIVLKSIRIVVAVFQHFFFLPFVTSTGSRRRHQRRRNMPGSPCSGPAPPATLETILEKKGLLTSLTMMDS